MYDFAKYGLLPGTLGLFLLGLALGLAALRSRRTARVGGVLLAVLVGGYWAMSMPAGAWLFGRIVSIGHSPVDDLAALADVQAIVVLDGGMARYGRDGNEIVVASRSSAVRALEASRIYKAIQVSLVVVTGGTYAHVSGAPEGRAIRDVLVTAGVPQSQIVLDSTSRNTREHALNVSALLRTKGINRIALVTSLVHMRRALRAFSTTGLHTVPAPAPLETSEPPLWWPNTAALDHSLEAWHEVFGLLRDLVRGT